MFFLGTFLLICVVVTVVTGATVASDTSSGLKVFSEVIGTDENGDQTVDEKNAVTPHSYKMMMLRASGSRARCWRCSYPVSRVLLFTETIKNSELKRLYNSDLTV